MLRDNIKRICDEKGMTVKELEREAQLGGCTVTRWNGDTTPNLKTLQKVAVVLDVTVDELLRGDADGQP